MFYLLIRIREYQNVVWKKIRSTTVVKDYLITSHRFIIVRENCVSSFVNLHFCYVLVIFAARWCFICEFLFVSPNVGLFGNSFFFLDCLRRTKGCELLILEYQNVVGTKLDWRYYHTYCRTLVHCLQIRNYYFTLVLCVWIYTCCHKLRNSNRYCGKIKKKIK